MHGFATPGVLVGANNLVGFASGASLPVGAVHPRAQRAAAAAAAAARAAAVVVQVAVAAAMVILGVGALVCPGIVPEVPAHDEPVRRGS